MPSSDINDELETLFDQAAKETKLPPNFLKAIAKQESGVNPSVGNSSQGAVGIMQMLPETARAMGADDPSDPTQAIPAAARYLREGYDKTGSLQGAAAYYHGGPDQKQWGPKTAAYVKAVGDHLAVLNTDPATEAGGMPGSPAEPTYASLSQSGVSPLPSAASKSPPTAPATSDDDILKMYAKPGVADTPGAAPPAPLSDDDLLKTYTKQADAAAVPDTAMHITVRPGPLANAPDDGVVASAAKDIGTGLVQGVGDAAGAVGGVKGLADYLLARGRSAATGEPVNKIMGDQTANQASMEANATPIGKLAAYINPLNYLPTSEGVGNKLLSMTGQYVPTSELGKDVQAGARVVTGALGPGSIGSAAPVPNLLTNYLKSAAPVLAASGAVGQGVTDTTGDPLMGMAAGAAPGVGLLGARAAGNRLIGTASPTTAALAQTARDTYGIPVKAGDMAESGFGRYLNSATKDLPFSGAGKTDAAQRSSFNNAVAQTFGESANKITPDVMARARDRIGGQFEDVAKQTPTITADRQLQSDLSNVVNNASASVTDSELAPIVKQAQNIVSAVDPATNTMTGAQYQALTKKGTPLAEALTSSNPNIKHFAGQLRDALDGAFERSAPPAVQQQLAEARGQWRNMRTIEGLVAKAPEGDISPALLQGRVNANSKGTYGTAYGGGGDLKTLADIGQRFLKPPPNSGTAPRLNAMNMLMNAGGVVGSGMTGSLMPLAATASPMIAQALAGRVIGGGLRSEALTNALIARSLGQARGGGNKLLNLALPYSLGASRNALVPQ